MKSPFDDEDPYELTELGAKFVHYVMNEVAPQIGSDREGRSNPMAPSGGSASS